MNITSLKRAYMLLSETRFTLELCNESEIADEVKRINDIIKSKLIRTIGDCPDAETLLEED